MIAAVNKGFKSELVDVKVIIIRRGERAALCKPQYYERDAAWFPLSQVEFCPQTDGNYLMTAPEWLLLEKAFL